MNNMVKTVFLVLMGVVVAMLLYLVFFGTWSLNGDSLVGTSTGTITQTSSWKGVLWNAAEAIETPIAKYYYDYCYIPNMYKDVYMDMALDGKLWNDATAYADLSSTKTNLQPTSSKDDFYTFQAGSVDYSTGWY